MSDGEEFEGVALAGIRDKAGALALECGAKLGPLLDTQLEVTEGEVEGIVSTSAVESDDPIVHQLCRTLGDSPMPVHVLVPSPIAATLACLQLAEETEAIEAARSEPLDAERRGAFQGVMKAVTGTVAEVLGADGMPSIEVQDAREIPDPASDPTWIEEGNFVRLPLTIGFEAFDSGRIDILLPLAPNESLGHGGPEQIWFIEPDPELRGRLVSMEDELGFTICVTTPEDVVTGGVEELAEATAIVVPWELAGRSGIEVVEMLRAGDETADCFLVMSSDAPTEGRVGAALRAGAHSFVAYPYDPEELRTRLTRLMKRADP